MQRSRTWPLILVLAACGGGDGGPTQPNNNNQIGSVQGTVVDQTGAAVPGAGIALQRTGQNTRNTTTDGAGSYSFTSVATGTWTVAVTPPAGFSLGSGTGTMSVTVAANQQASVAPIAINKQAPGGPPPAAVEVSMVNVSFNPQQIEVAAGGTIRFTNNDGVDHNATSSQFLTGNLAPGQNREVRVNNPGTINYSCTLHVGMNGSVVVR